MPSGARSPMCGCHPGSIAFRPTPSGILRVSRELRLNSSLATTFEPGHFADSLGTPSARTVRRATTSRPAPMAQRSGRRCSRASLRVWNNPQVHCQQGALTRGLAPTSYTTTGDTASIPIDVGRVASARWSAVVWHLCVGDGRLADDVVPPVDI